VTSRGFTLLEVLVALTILGLAIVTLMQLSSQGLRLLRHADDYQRAVLVADRIVRTALEGPFQWERRVGLMAVPEDLTPGAGPRPRLVTLSVVVRWGGNRTLELASLRTVAGTPAP
jgi:prepilin-type N-terminal cleavage/methylation domain-containing protein